MLVHSGIAVASKADAENLFEDILGLKLLYTFHIEPDTISTLFGIQTAADARVYEMINARLEVFIISGLQRKSPGFDHLCITVPDMSSTIEKAEKIGLTVRRFKRDTGDVVFMEDRSGNLFELKPEQP
jgi:catechol 2,3-dioxygenase-like lactoylglutathione lyase family enzyme